VRTCPGIPRDSRLRTSVARAIDRYCDPGEFGGAAPPVPTDAKLRFPSSFADGSNPLRTRRRSDEYASS
jgi:hypothetical protein